MIATKEDIKRATEVMLAYAQGKTIQRQDPNGKWNDCPVPMFDWAGYNYRIKPQLTDIQPNQWISVEDDLPCNHEELMDGEFQTKFVIVSTNGINKYFELMYNYPPKGWIWSSEAIPKYWMPIPELPKE